MFDILDAAWLLLLTALFSFPPLAFGFKQGWIEGLAMSVGFLPHMAMAWLTKFPMIGRIVVISRQDVTLRRRGIDVFSIEWANIGAACLRPYGGYGIKVVFSDRSGRQTGEISIGPLDGFVDRRKPLVEEIRRNLPPGVALMDDRWKVRGSKRAHFIGTSLSLVIGFICFWLWRQGYSLGQISRYKESLYNGSGLFGFIAIFALTIGIADSIILMAWKTLNSRGPKVYGALPVAEGPPVAALSGMPAVLGRRVFRYRQEVRNPDLRKLTRKSFRELGIIGALLESALIGWLLVAAANSVRHNILWAGGIAGTLIIGIIFAYVLSLARRHLRRVEQMSATMNDEIVIDDREVFVRRGDRLIPALVIQESRLTPYSGPGRGLDRMETCLRVEGVECWYDPSCMEEVNAG